MRRSLVLLSLAVALSSCDRSRGSDCSVGGVKQDLLAAVDRDYLYLDLLPASIDPTAYATPDDLLAALTATARAQGKDRGWSFLMPLEQYLQYFRDAQSVGYGLSLLTTGAAPSLQVFVKQVFAGSAADQAGFVRGDQILAAGPDPSTLTDVAGLTADQVSALLSAGGAAGVAKAVQVMPLGGGNAVIRTMSSAIFDLDPVASVKVFGTTGYVQLRTFVPSAEAALQSAFAQFQSQGVQNVVVDLRYNGGGSLDTAAYLADLLGGGRIDGQPMVYLQFNANRPDQTSLSHYAFHRQPESATPQRIAFITTGGSASASELVPNAIDAYPSSIRVGYVGSTTYGKPVGQLSGQLGSCDAVLFLVAFQLVNANGNVDYFSGLPDAKSNGPLCPAPDDLTHAQDSMDEASTAAAVYFAENGTCPPAPAAPAGVRARAPAAPIDQLGARARTLLQRDMPGTF